MRRYILILAVTAAALSITACNSSSQKDAKATEAAKPKGKYYCTMHPDVTSDKPGTCSKCGMELVERDTTK
ncbi:hypothetical protein FPZ42_03405 [Mucilaginibacter achroorhodeus]|uniref:Heavy metal binding domain-containing protein n=1 Tax=Mucilaginibacter achroorhodeus TaxID=2599294 RepID=A0A563UAA0_9SPHI|nr:heavy metal-binding domain-containing protein [Mucilaginibacter achroorhodeus]TWR28275.1 hypothetical protein FPZ42_03405 [Mucilaginibacter achroorhodeus]